MIVLSVVWVVQNIGDDEREDEGEKDKVGYVDGTTLFSGHLTQDDVEFVRFDSREEGMDALLAEDVYLAGSILLFFGIFLLIGNLIADIALAWLDPRIRYE